jgi:hypothetical protein
VCALLSTAVLAGGRNPADYPLRVHIYQIDNNSHYRYHDLDYVDGEGRANLYENGDPKGFDFHFRCDNRLLYSSGYETYPARWKKPGRTLEILQKQFGKPGAYEACELQVEMKASTAYYRKNGLLYEEPAAEFKQWMEKLQYDPEHGKNEPVKPVAAPATAPAPASTTPFPAPAQAPAGTPATGTNVPPQSPRQ